MNDLIKLIVLMVVTAGFLTVFQIFPRVGLYTIAKRRHIRRPWVAWLPLGNQYMLGKISDQYQEKVRGRRTHRCWAVPVLGCLSWIGQLVATFLILLMLLYVLIMMFAAVGSLGLIFLNNRLEDLFGDLREPFVAMCIIGIVSSCGMIIRYMALYDLYRSTTVHRTKFLVLSILFPVTEPAFIFLCKDPEPGVEPLPEIYASESCNL